MVVLRNVDIQEQFNYLTTIDNILDKEVRQISGNKKYIDKIVPEYLKLKYSQKEILANTFCGVIFFISSLDFTKVSPTFLMVLLIGSI